MLSYKYRLYPNRAQAAALSAMLSDFCELYNAALQQRVEAYRRRGLCLSYVAQTYEIKDLRREDERFRRYSHRAAAKVLKRVDLAFGGFFRRVKAGDTPGFPRYRSAARYNSADLEVGHGLAIKRDGRIAVTGIPGRTKVRWHRELPAVPKTATVTRSLGKWYIAFQVEVDALSATTEFCPVGVDLGLTSIIALSTGETVPAPQCSRRDAKRQRRLQRVVCRRNKGSRRREKAKRAVAAHYQRVARRRRDFAHKTARALVADFTHIAMENLNFSGLAGSCLARSINDAAWAQLVRFVTYKAEYAGRTAVLVDPRGTSQTCPSCGQVATKTLKVRTHECDCGCVLDRDVAAAIIVLQRANFGPGTGLQAPTERIAA